MQLKALGIYLPRQQRVGVLFQYALAPDMVITRFVADEDFIRRPAPPTLSAAFLADSEPEQQALWRDVRSLPMNGRHAGRASPRGTAPGTGAADSAGRDWLLPAFFQNLLPEGVFRDHVAALRGCDPQDHFEMLAACGGDLPGALYALPVELSRDELARYVTQDNDALEMSVTADPLEQGVSLSGVQPKLGAIRRGERYVGRTRDHDTHVIIKLPVPGQPRLPEVEELSLRLARAAGVDACLAQLEPLDRLDIPHGYDLGEPGASPRFLAVPRFDRSPAGRLHCEDLAQVLGVMPEDKYGERLPAARGGGRTSYLDVAAVLLGFPSLGEPAVHELLRRLVVNELLGNPDMHLKNIGLLYPGADGRQPVLSPAYDVVAYAAFQPNHGHALALLPPGRMPPAKAPAPGETPAKPQLSPAVLRAFCEALAIPEKPAAAVLRDAVRRAVQAWPALIEDSELTPAQRQRLLAHFNAHPMVVSLRRRTRAG